MKEDFSAFLNVDEFAVEVQAENPARTFAAIFDNEGQVFTLGGLELSTTLPELTTAHENCEDFTPCETTVTVPGHANPFTVKSVKPDGTGWATVELVP